MGIVNTLAAMFGLGTRSRAAVPSPVAAEDASEIVDQGFSDIAVYPAGSSQPATKPPGAGRYPVAHALTFSGVFNTVSRVYRQSDEAIRDSVQNARMMRTDCAIMESLEARQRAVALLKWRIEPEEAEDPRAKKRCAVLTKLIERVPDFLEYRRSLLDALWYGRSANSQRFDRVKCGGREYWSVAGWRPINGDKLIFKFGLRDDDHACEDAVGVRVNAMQATDRHDGKKHFRGRTLELTDRGYAYFLHGSDRPLLALHRHIIEDGVYEDPLSAGRIHGVGIRDRIYWAWYLQKETMATIMEVIERCGTGFTIYYYTQGSAASKAEVEKIAAENTGNNRIIVPRDSTAPDAPMIDRVEPSTAGVEALRSIVHEYFGHMIKRYIVGQTMTSEPSGAGLGSTLAEVQLGTFLQIVQYDAIKLSETLTRELLEPLKRFNFPDAADSYDRFVIETEGDKAKERIEAFRAGWEMGLKIPAKVVAEALNIRDPEPGEEVLSNQGQAGPEMPGAGGDSSLDRIDDLAMANAAEGDESPPQLSRLDKLRARLAPPPGSQSEPEGDDDKEDPNERAQALADIVSGLFDETTLAQVVGDDRERYASDEVIRLRYVVDDQGNKHDELGRFAEKSGEAQAERLKRYREADPYGEGLNDPDEPATLEEIAKSRNKTLKELRHELANRHRDTIADFRRFRKRMRDAGPGLDKLFTESNLRDDQDWEYASALRGAIHLGLMDDVPEDERKTLLDHYENFRSRGYYDGWDKKAQRQKPIPAKWDPVKKEYYADAEAQRLRYAWNPTDHPRGKNGRFIPKGSPEAFSSASDRVRELATGPRTPEAASELMSHLNLLTTKQLHELKRAHGIQASGKVKSQRFQYKVTGIGEEGVGQELKGTSTWNPELGGTLLVWRDPKDGQDYVVNGHHRHELAGRAGQETLNVRYLEASDAKTARAKGALANIAEGRGSAVDAAKYLRDTGADAEHLRKAGVSLSGKIAADATTLTNLGDKAFQALAEGRLEESQAVAVARHLKDPALQDVLFKKLAAREDEGKDWSTREIETAAKKMANAGKVTQKGADLFGMFEDEQSTFDQEVEIESHVSRLLGQEANDFNAVANQRRAERVADAGNTLATDENARRARAARSAAELFEQQSGLKGEIADTIKKHAAALATAKSKKERDRVKREAFDDVKRAVERFGQGSAPEARKSVEADAGATGGGGTGLENRDSAASGGARGGSDIAHPRNWEEHRARYLSQHGKVAADGSIDSVVLNTDDWRDHFAEYVGTNAHAVHEQASALNKRLFSEALKATKGKGNGRMLFLAGGGGSGKGTATRDHFTLGDYPMVMDQASDNYEKLEGKFDEAIKAGFTPEHVFIDRGVLDAASGIVGRALGLRKKGEMARTVPLSIATKANIEARKATLRLLKERPDIDAKIVDNTQKQGRATLITDRAAAIAHLEKRVKEEDADYASLSSRLENEMRARHAAGEIPDDILDGLMGEGFAKKPN